MPVGAVHSTLLFAQGGHHQPGTRDARLPHPLRTSPWSPGQPLSLGLRTEVLRGLCGLAGRPAWASQPRRRSTTLSGARKTTDRKGLYVSVAGLSQRKFSSFLRPM